MRSLHSATETTPSGEGNSARVSMPAAYQPRFPGPRSGFDDLGAWWRREHELGLRHRLVDYRLLEIEAIAIPLGVDHQDATHLEGGAVHVEEHFLKCRRGFLGLRGQHVATFESECARIELLQLEFLFQLGAAEQERQGSRVLALVDVLLVHLLV